MAKPIKTLELHYPMIQFLINVHIYSSDADYQTRLPFQKFRFSRELSSGLNRNVDDHLHLDQNVLGVGQGWMMSTQGETHTKHGVADQQTHFTSQKNICFR